MSNPYYRVTVPGRIRLHPRDMNNNILENIKNEALKGYNEKCFRDYGYVDGIYKISETNNSGKIQSEDPTSSGLYTVDIDCRMLVPIPNETVYSKIIGINKKIITAETGQLKIVIYEESINKNNIRYIRNAYYPIDSEGAPTGDPIQQGTQVIIRLTASRIVPNKTNILSIGILESVVPPENYGEIHGQKEEPSITISEIEALRGRNITESSDVDLPETTTESDIESEKNETSDTTFEIETSDESDEE
jgi:DNA-directed RNA polymerase subunit E'/Rpb7